MTFCSSDRTDYEGQGYKKARVDALWEFSEGQLRCELNDLCFVLQQNVESSGWSYAILTDES